MSINNLNAIYTAKKNLTFLFHDPVRPFCWPKQKHEDYNLKIEP